MLGMWPRSPYNKGNESCEEESVMGEESLNLNETELDSDSHEDSAHEGDNDDTMSVNEIIAPTCSEKTIKRKLLKKQDVNSQKFKQLFQAISDMF